MRARRRCSMRCASIPALARTPTCSRRRSRTCARRSSTGSRAMRRCRHRPQPQPSAPQVWLHRRPAGRRAARPWSDALFGEHLEIIHPISKGDEAEIGSFTKKRCPRDGASSSTGRATNSGSGASCARSRRAPVTAGRRSCRWSASRRSLRTRPRRIASVRTKPSLSRSGTGRLAGSRLRRATEGRPLCLIRFLAWPFEADEEHLFFGREKEIDELLRKAPHLAFHRRCRARREAASRRSCAPG